jgi:L-fucose isomerase-like protein
MYIVNSRVDSPEFERGFKTFIGAARAAKNFLGARIGQVGTRPQNFYTVIINEQELLSRWGIEMVPLSLLRLQQNLATMLASDKRIKEEAAAIRGKINVQVDDEALMKVAALKLFMTDWARNENLSAIAFKCHEDLPDAMSFYSCFANGELTSLDIPVACETDIHGALSSLLLQSASLVDTPTFFADLTIRHPENDNAELLWHCGNFPHSLCKNKNSAFIGGHCNIAGALPGTGNFEIMGGDITIARLDGLNGEYSLLMGHGKSTTGPFNLGTYIWIEVPDWPLWEEKIIYGPYIHHVAGIHGHAAPALYEATRFIPGLKADPVQPTEEEIREYLRGK